MESLFVHFNKLLRALALIGLYVLFMGESFGEVLNLPYSCKLGEERWVAGCGTRVTASWDGCSAPSKSDSCTTTSPPGWIIMDHKLQIISQSNGGHSVSRIAEGQQFDYYNKIEEAYDYAIDAAGKYSDSSARYEAEAHFRESKECSLRRGTKFPINSSNGSS